jgi:hypothetical protein
MAISAMSVCSEGYWGCGLAQRFKSWGVYAWLAKEMLAIRYARLTGR